MFEINLCVTTTQHIAVEAVLEELGASSISLHDAKNESVFVQELNKTPLWKHILVTALFDKYIELQLIQDTLEQVLACSIEISQQTVHDHDWQNTYKQDFQPMHFGKRLWVCPSWCITPDPFAINIRLDSGIAFGTGTHPSTALCLEWLAKHPPHNLQVMDFGCGSGILAIAAYYLGAKSIVAIDHDPQATQACYTNIKHNRVPLQTINVINADDVDGTGYHLVMANILLRPLIHLEQQFAKSLATDGKIILSGILQTQLAELKQHYLSHFSIDQVYVKKEWLLVEVSRR